VFFDRHGCGRGGRSPHAMPSRRGEAKPPFSVLSRVELSRVPYHGPLQVEPMAAASKPSLRGEWLRPSKESAINSRLPKRMVLPREKSPCDGHSQSAATASADEGTIETSRGKACYKSPFLERQLSMFFVSVIIGW
jgi:hypothetical protein